MGCCCCCKKKNSNENDLEAPLLENEEIKSIKKEEDFQKIKLLGKGTFGRVILVRQNSDNQLYAMKILSKKFLKEKNEQEHTKTERKLLAQVNCPFIVKLHYAFQDSQNLFLVSDFIQGGDLFFHIRREKFFPNEKAKFYIAEIILVIDYLHKKNMIYRDLKPENILIDKEGHIKLTDFGLSKIIDKKKKKANTICGTPQYLAPEIFKEKGYDKTVDWWSLGCLLYEMLSGRVLFRFNGSLDLSIYKKPLILPNNFTESAKKFLKDILVVNPKNRLGYGENGAEKIKNHEYFQDINWENLANKQIKPPFIPEFKNETDLSYFDREFTEESLNASYSSENFTMYPGFTYFNKNLEIEK